MDDRADPAPAAGSATPPDAMSDRNDRVCVVGGGPGGLCVAAALEGRGIPFDIVDAGSAPGGIWDIAREDSPMYESAHFISSRTLSALPDHPMPEDYPDYPRHDQVLAYVRSFARTHGLERHATFGTQVVRAGPGGDGTWLVERDDGDVARYGALVVAAGANWHPRLPDFPGRFGGESYHSVRYRSPEEFRGKRVVIVGAGNSGCDIACDAAQVAERAVLSLRRGYHFVPKYVFGMPADVFAHQGPTLPGWLEQRVFGVVLRLLVGDLRRYGLPKPDHRVLESHPIMNTQVLHHLGHGDLVARPDVQELRSRSVVFADGSEELADLVLFATGYERRYPFLDDDVLGAVDGRLDLYLNVFHRMYSTLAFMGVFETDGAAYSLMGLQADLIAGYLSDRREGRAGAHRFDALRSGDRPDLRGGRRYTRSPRHAYYVKSDAYERALRRTRKRMGWA